MTDVSVVLPVFNRAGTVKAAIDSVLSQDAPECSTELIVVDDGSSDDLTSVLQPYGPQVTCIRHERNAGAAAARNTGVAAARGTYVAFIDSDDEWLAGKLTTQLAEMRRRQWLASCTAYYLVRPGAAVIASPRFETGSLGVEDMVWGCFVSPGTTLMFERRLFSEIGSLDVTLRRLEDWDWLLRYAYVHPLGFIARPLARVHVGPHADAAPVLAAIDELFRKHAGKLRGRVRRHFEAALDLEKAAALYRSGRIASSLLPLLRSLARSPINHKAFAAVWHNYSPRA